jgi:hypothetical protein
MVETISPVVYGGRTRWGAALALHAVGAAVTAAGFGAALGLVGAALGAPWGRAGALALAATALAYAIGELPRVTVAVPQLRRQVPDWWRTFFAWPIAATLYGAGLGIGFFTYLAHGTLVVVSFAALASGDPILGAVVVGSFGVARGLSAATAAGVRSQRDSQRLVDRLAASSERRRSVANGAVLVVVAGLGVAVAVRTVGGWASLATAGLAGVFAWAAISKAAGRAAWRHALAEHRLPPRVRSIAVWGVPAAEALVPALAISGLPGAAGAWALVLLAAFTVEALSAWRRVGPRVPCGCFGGRGAVRPATLLLRNGMLALLAAISLARTGPGLLLSWPGLPGHDELVPMMLAAAGVGVAGFTAWTAIRWLGRGARA